MKASQASFLLTIVAREQRLRATWLGISLAVRGGPVKEYRSARFADWLSRDVQTVPLPVLMQGGRHPTGSAPVALQSF
jgi:hypothetical protein